MSELLVITTLADRRCAFRAIDVHSILEIESLTPVPRSPPHVLGLTTRRSQAICVIDCRSAIGMEAIADPIGKRAAIVEHDGHFFALLVDAIEDVTHALSAPQGVPGGFGSNWSTCSTGMAETQGKPALVLDPKALIAGSPQPRIAA